MSIGKFSVGKYSAFFSSAVKCGTVCCSVGNAVLHNVVVQCTTV